MESGLKHVSHLKVLSYHINRFGEVSTPVLFWYMQEIAWEHARVLGFGFEHLREEQLFWVLSRFRARIGKRPRWREEFTLETWSRGTDGFFAYRDFRFLDMQGREMITATSSWLVLDLESRKIQRPDRRHGFPPYAKSLFGRDAERLPSPGSVGDLCFSPVEFNEIDINQHFNSGRYLERLNNSHSFEFHESHRLKEMEINFLKEGMPEDRLAVVRQELHPGTELSSVVRESDRAELIRARLTWENAG